TEEGTVLVQDIFPGPAGSLPRELGNVGGRLFFSADDGVHGRELWMATADGGEPGGGGQGSLAESGRDGDPGLGVAAFLAATRSVSPGQPSIPTTTAASTRTEVVPSVL